MSSVDATQSIQRLLLSMEKMSSTMKGREEDLQFLRDMLISTEFHSIMTLHKELSSVSTEKTNSCSSNAISLVNMVSYDCEIESNNCKEAKELVDLLSSPHLEALLLAHDKIANKEYPVQAVNTTPSENHNTEYNKQERTISIEKGNDPLGATVKLDSEGNIIISRILVGGAAYRCGVLSPGSIVHKINGHSIHGYNADQVAELMQGLTGNITFTVSSVETEIRLKRWGHANIFMKSLFSYDPSLDCHHPCKEAGFRFDQGTVMQVVNQDDPDWWQVVREGDRRARAGIIPSKTFQERISTYENVQQNVSPRSKYKAIQYSSSLTGAKMITYEEVVKIEAQVDRPRPILLVAPRGPPFDIDSIKSRLLLDDPDMYGSPIAHTSRDQTMNEVNSVDFFFVTRRKMEQDIQNKRFVEHAFYEGHYYGISIDSIRKVINDGKTCLLVVSPEALSSARTPEIRPFIVYLKPPSAEFMKQHWVPKSWIKESGIADVIRQAAHMEQNYGHYFDHTILFSDATSAQQNIVHVTHRLRKDRQWVPASWSYIWQD